MPFLTGPLLSWLASLDGAAMAEAGGRPPPLLARCPTEHLPELREALAERRSLRAALGELAPRIVSERELSDFGDPERLCFNVNDAADLRLAESWSQAGQGPGGGTHGDGPPAASFSCA